MVNKAASEGLEITKLNIKVQSLAGKVKALEEGRTAPDNLHDQAENLRRLLVALKLRMQRAPQAEDGFRKLALETELGRILLQIDGIL